MSVQVWLDYHLGKTHAYSVMVDGTPYDHFTSTTGPLTWSQQNEVAHSYAEALRGYDAPS